jgi:hypothetical protein
LIEEAGSRLLVDPGYAIVPRLLEVLPAADVDAVFVSHGHPDTARTSIRCCVPGICAKTLRRRCRCMHCPVRSTRY